MADVNLGRASLSVTADLSGFTTALDSAAKQTEKLTVANSIVANSSNNVTTTLEKQVLSFEQLQQAAVAGSINATAFKQSAAASKLLVDQLVLLDGSTLLLKKDENELQFQQAKLNTSYVELENNLLKNDAAFKNNSLLIELNTQKQKVLTTENKLLMASMLAVDDQAIGYAATQKTLNAEIDLSTRKFDLQTRQMMLETGATKALHDELVKLEEQEKALALAEDKVKGINQPVPIIEPPKVNTNTPAFVQEQINLKSNTDLATKALELQARQMNVDSGATKKLHDEMTKLEEQEKVLIALENKAKGILPPVIKPPPVPENKNTAAFVLNSKKMALETDLLNKKLDQQARQMMIDSGAAAKLAKELSALEKAEKKLADTEQKINAAAGRGNNAKEMVKAAPKAASGGMKLKDMLGIGFFTAAFNKVFDGAIALVQNIVSSVVDLGTKIIESGSKFQELDRRLTTLTGFKGIAAGLQDIMKTGPSAGFTALGEAATRLAALKFNPQALQPLIKNFNNLGVALGNPEKILNLITDKIADMASEGSATMAALGKLAEEGIPVFESLAQSMGVSVEDAKRRVKEGLVTVSEATQAISDAANMPNMIAAAQASANSFSGIFSRVTNNIEVLFQNIGVKILDGFGLINLQTSLGKFFDQVFLKAEELSPVFEKVGAVVAAITQKVLDALVNVLSQFSMATEKMTVEDMLAEIEKVAENLVKTAIDFIKELKPFVEILLAGAKQLVIIASNLGNIKNHIKQDVKDVQNFFNPPKPENLDQFTIMELMDLQNEFINQVEQMDNAIDQLGPIPNLAQDNFLKDLEKAIKASGDSIAAELDKINNLPLMQEAPKWQKFLDENLSPLQQYQREIEKLNMLMDGSEQGFQAFAIGSSNALQKLKQSTGMGGEPKFASAITKGSAEDFKATLDAQNKNKDVNQEIKELMQVAAEIQQQQLDAQIAIAQAIKAQAPAQVLAFCGPV